MSFSVKRKRNVKLHKLLLKMQMRNQTLNHCADRFSVSWMRLVLRLLMLTQSHSQQ